MRPLRITSLLVLLALAACSGGNDDDDDDDITTVPDDDDDTTTTANDDDDTTVPDDDDDTTTTANDDDDTTVPEIVERSLAVTDSITFYWNEHADDPVTPAPTASALAGEVPGWDETADAMRLTPVLEGLPDGAAFPLGARWEITLDEAIRGALDELLPDAYATITDASGTEYAYNIWEDGQFVIPVEHFSSFAVLLGGGSLASGIGGGNAALIAFLTGLANGNGFIANFIVNLFLNQSCGNLTKDVFEACDGNVACASACYSGTQSCSADCKTLSDTCETGTQACGNGALEGCEVCDGSALECFNGCYFGSNACSGDCSGFAATCDIGTQVCGNGLIEGCEVCDDAAANGTPGMCNTTCTFPNKIRCGNLIKEGFEICDGGTADCNDGCYEGVKYCYNDCNGYGGCEVGSQRCGNEKIDGCEVCDDGPLGACLDDCTGEATEFCGDGYVTGTEQCDSLGLDTFSCDSDCTTVSCGDAHPNKTAGESCDDGPGGTCFDDCSAMNVCGDSIVFAGETCDSGGVDTTGCDNDCTAVACGDAHPNVAAGETCDMGGDTITCDGDCTVATCGDSYTNAAAGETCDTGGDSATCDSDCTAASCGDSYTNTAAGETCDDGAPQGEGLCINDCSGTQVCGNGTANGTEACDDGDTTECGLCNATCTANSPADFCGDGLTCGAETCDDGDNTECGLCNAACSGASAADTCGDTLICGGEICDDGNATECGLCNATCTAASAADTCGDGVVCATETCDGGAWSPVLLGSNAAGSTAGLDSRLYALGNRVYVANDASGLTVLDVTGAMPAIIGTYDTPDVARGVAVSGNYAYVCDRTTLEVLDVSSMPPTLAGSATGWAYYSIKISGGRAYIAGGNAGLLVYDLSVPATPAFLGRYDTPDFAREAWISGNRAYVADGAAGLVVLDISVAPPTLVGSLDTPGIAMAVAVSGNYAYVSDFSGGVVVMDVSTATPTLVATYSTGGNAIGTFAHGNRLYVYESLSGLRVYDISNPATERLVGSHYPGSIGRVFVSGNRTYLNGSNGLHAYDISEPCGANCAAAACGDGIVNGTEACDGNNPVNGETCNGTCTGP